jgi:competence protein ComEC
MKRNFVLFLRMALALAALAFAVALAWPDQRLTATVFDVGQGDAILVQCGTQQMLVDGGPDNTVLARLGSAMPFFDRTIESVVLTHPHSDHFFGLIGVFSRYKVRHFYTSGGASDMPEYRALLEAVRASGARVSAVRPGDSLDIAGCGHADALWPDRSRTDVITKDANTESVVLRVARNDAASPGAAILLMGDATAAVEHALLKANAPLQADVLKVGHHGSRTSSTPEFLRAVGPKEAIMSLGAKNKFGHPAPVTLLRLRAVGAQAYRTDRDGSVFIIIGKDNAHVEGTKK